jgi:hypothetical protein
MRSPRSSRAVLDMALQAPCPLLAT